MDETRRHLQEVHTARSALPYAALDGASRPLEFHERSAHMATESQPGRKPAGSAGQQPCPISTRHILGIPYGSVAQQYSFGPQLGEGRTGVVRSCVDAHAGERLACKTMPKSRMTSASDLENVRAEVRVLEALKGHPAVVGMRRVVEDEQNVHIMMELCEGGDLFERIKQRTSFPEEDAAQICFSLASFLRLCGKKGIMHRDLKPENILLTSTRSHVDVKVVDFGQAVYITEGVKLTKPVGTQYYIAPEVLNCSYGLEADMWSLGVIFYTLLCGVPPFFGETTKDIFMKIQTGVFDIEKGPWRAISSQAKDLVCRMLCKDPTKRITPEEVQAHSWIQRHCSQRLGNGTWNSYPQFHKQHQGDIQTRSKISLHSMKPPSPHASTLLARSPLGNPQSELSSIQVPHFPTSPPSAPTSPQLAEAFSGSPHDRFSRKSSCSPTSPPQGSPLSCRSPGLPPKVRHWKGGNSPNASHSYPSSQARSQTGGPDRIVGDKQFRSWSNGSQNLCASNTQRSPTQQSPRNSGDFYHQSASTLIAAIAEKLRPRDADEDLFPLVGDSQKTIVSLDLEGMQVQVEYDQQMHNFGIYFHYDKAVPST